MVKQAAHVIDQMMSLNTSIDLAAANAVSQYRKDAQAAAVVRRHPLVAVLHQRPDQRRCGEEDAHLGGARGVGVVGGGVWSGAVVGGGGKGPRLPFQWTEHWQQMEQACLWSLPTSRQSYPP